MNGVRMNGMKEQEQRLRRMEIQFGRARLVPRPWELFGHQVNIIPRPRDSDPDQDPDLSLSLDLHRSPVILRSNGAIDRQESGSGLFSPGSDLADDEAGDGDVFNSSPSPCLLSPVNLVLSQYLREDVSEGLCSDLDPSPSPPQLSPIFEECSSCPPSASSELDDCFASWGDGRSGVSAYTVSVSSSGYNSAVGTSSDSLLQDGDASTVGRDPSSYSLLQDGEMGTCTVSSYCLDQDINIPGQSDHSIELDHSYELDYKDDQVHDVKISPESTCMLQPCEINLLVDTEDMSNLAQSESGDDGFGNSADSILDHTDTVMTDVSQEFDPLVPSSTEDTCRLKPSAEDVKATDKRATLSQERTVAESFESCDGAKIVFSGRESPVASRGSQDSFERHEKSAEMESAGSFDSQFSKDAEDIITALGESSVEKVCEITNDEEKIARGEACGEFPGPGDVEDVHEHVTTFRALERPVERTGDSQDVDPESANNCTVSSNGLLTEGICGPLENSRDGEETFDSGGGFAPPVFYDDSRTEQADMDQPVSGDSKVPASVYDTRPDSESWKNFTDTIDEEFDTFLHSSTLTEPGDIVDSKENALAFAMDSKEDGGSVVTVADDVPENVNSSHFPEVVESVPSTNRDSGIVGEPLIEHSRTAFETWKSNRASPVVFTQTVPDDADSQDVVSKRGADRDIRSAKTSEGENLFESDAMLYEDRDQTSSALCSFPSFDEEINDISKNGDHAVSTYTDIGDGFSTSTNVLTYSEELGRTSGNVDKCVDDTLSSKHDESDLLVRVCDEEACRSSRDVDEESVVRNCDKRRGITHHRTVPSKRDSQFLSKSADTTDSVDSDSRLYSNFAQENVHSVSDLANSAEFLEARSSDSKSVSVTDQVCDRDDKRLPQSDTCISIPTVGTGKRSTKPEKEGFESSTAFDQSIRADGEKEELDVSSSSESASGFRGGGIVDEIIAETFGDKVSGLWAINSNSNDNINKSSVGISSDDAQVPASEKIVRTKSIVRSSNNDTAQSTVCVCTATSTCTASSPTTLTAISLTARATTTTTVPTTHSLDLAAPTCTSTKGSTTKKVLPMGKARRGHTNNISHLLDKWSALELASATSSSLRAPQRPSSSLKFSRQLSKSFPSLAFKDGNDSISQNVTTYSVTDQSANQSDAHSVKIPKKHAAAPRASFHTKEMDEKKIVLIEKTGPDSVVAHPHHRVVASGRECPVLENMLKGSVSGLPSVHSLVEKFSHSDTESNASMSPLTERRHQAVTLPRRHSLTRTVFAHQEDDSATLRTKLTDESDYSPSYPPTRHRTSSLTLRKQSLPSSSESQHLHSEAASGTVLEKQTSSRDQDVAKQETSSLAETRQYWISLQPKSGTSSSLTVPRNRAASSVGLPSSSSSEQEWVSLTSSTLPPSQRRLSTSAVTWHSKEEELRQDGHMVYKAREEQSYTDTGFGSSGPMREEYGAATTGGVQNGTQREDFHFSEMSSVKSQFERGPQESTPQRRPVDIREEVAHSEGGVYESQPATFQPQYDDEPEEGVYENQPQQRPDLARESDRNIGAELPSIGTAKSMKEKFLKGEYERSSGIVKREAAPPDVIDGGVYENQPQYNPDVVHAGEQQQEQLPEQGYARNIAGRFKELEKQGSVPSPHGRREITPDRSGKVEYVSEPRGQVERYEGHAETGVFESQPRERADVVRSDQLAEEILPERGTAKNVAERFKQMSSGTPSPAPRGKRELTPDTSGRVEYVSEPRGRVETYEGKAESGVFESQPAEREDVVKSDQLSEEILPERGAAKNIAAKFREMEKGTKSPPSPSKFKEFTPPRENGSERSAGVYESNPTRSPDVVTSEEHAEEILPERGTAKNLVNRFRQLSSGDSNPAKSPRAKKEFTPPPQEGVVFENNPRQFIADYNRPAESGILESTPEVRQDVVRGDEPPKYEEELPERGFTRNLVSAWRQRETESAKISPTASGKPKEFTPPREEPRVAQQRPAPRTPKSPAAGAGLSEGSVHPMDLPGQYQPQEGPSVFESEPQRRDDVVREDDTDWAVGMPKPDTTKKMLAKFRNIQAEASKESPRPQPTGRKAGDDSSDSTLEQAQNVRR